MRFSTPRLLFFVWIAGLLAAGATAPSRAPAQEPSTPGAQNAGAQWQTMSDRFDGVWRLAVPVAQARRTVEGAVDRAVNAMNFFLRGVARPMIRDNTPVNEEIELRFRTRQNLYVRFDHRAEYTSGLGRTRTVQTPDGDPMRLTQRFRDDTLEQVFQADNGTRWNVFTILPDGRMRMSATTHGDMMPQPLRFSLTYRRR